MKDFHQPAKRDGFYIYYESVEKADVMVRGTIVSALAAKLNTTIDKLKIYSVGENIDGLTYTVVYKEVL